MKTSRTLVRGKTQIVIKIVENGKITDRGTFSNVSSAKRFMNKY